MYKLKHVYPQSTLHTIYNALIVPHFTYCLVVWGSKIEYNHPLHLIQKKALRIVANKDFIAHTEPICKELHLLKVPDMYQLSLWKFYFKLMNGKLPLYFEFMKPTIPVICDYYQIRRPVFHQPKINHDFAEHLVEYQMINLLNDNDSFLYVSKVQTHSFEGFKFYIKKKMIDSYKDHCILTNCESCYFLLNRR